MTPIGVYIQLHLAGLRIYGLNLLKLSTWFRIRQSDDVVSNARPSLLVDSTFDLLDEDAKGKTVAA